MLDDTRYGFDRYANVRMAYGPSYSPDGKLLSFSTDLSGNPQLWLFNLQTRRMDQLTFHEDRVSGARFSPTNREIIYAMDKGGNEKHQVWMFDLGTLASSKISSDDSKIYLFGDFDKDGERICYSSNERDDRYFDIYTLRLSGPLLEPNLVMKSDHTNRALGWLNRDRLLIERANTNLDNDLFVMSDKCSDDLVCITDHSGEASFGYAGFSSDGSRVFVITDVDREFSQPAVIDVSTGRLRFLVEENDAEAFGGRVSDDGRLMAYFRNVNGASIFHIYDLLKGRDRVIEGLPLGSVEGPVVSGALSTWSRDSRVFTFTFQGPMHNANLWSYDMTTDGLQQITFVSLAGIPGDSFVEPVRTRFPSFDGLQVPLLAYRPKSKVPLPTIVYVHGGPESQETVRFNIAVQYFVNSGFLVLAPNVRGSTGYGKRWVHLDDVEKRLDSVHDLDSLAEWAVRQKLAVKGKIGLMGSSYGGFMVLSALTEYPDRWAAGVCSVGISNFETFLEHTAKWRRHLREAEYGSLERNRELFRRISPIHHVEKIVAPLMLVHGANDPRVPVEEAEQIVSCLKGLGRKVEYLRLEDEGHGISKISNRVIVNTMIGEFFESTLLGRE